jgi:glutathione S-transferase
MPLIVLYQAEWCPHSHAVRLRLTELGLDFVARQVEPERPQRARMRDAIGVEAIPTLVDEDGTVVSGEGAILRHLDERYGPGTTAAAEHREKLRAEHELWTATLERETGG